MGLDFNGSKAHWSYGGFNRFRTRIAECIGIKYDSMRGLGGSGSWEKVKDPIKQLLIHSDCDGEMSPKECKSVAPRLRQLIANWPDDDYDKQQAILLADGMEECAESKRPLQFT